MDTRLSLRIRGGKKKKFSSEAVFKLINVLLKRSFKSPVTVYYFITPLN